MSDDGVLRAGDLMVAIRQGGQDARGYPLRVPEIGQVYRLTSIYDMRYGYGCTLEDMDPSPYKGFLLFVKDGVNMRGGNKVRPGWYFRRVTKAEAPAEAGWFQSLFDKEKV